MCASVFKETFSGQSLGLMSLWSEKREPRALRGLSLFKWEFGWLVRTDPFALLFWSFQILFNFCFRLAFNDLWVFKRFLLINWEPLWASHHQAFSLFPCSAYLSPKLLSSALFNKHCKLSFPDCDCSCSAHI